MEEIKNLKIKYKNGRDNIGADLINPCLKECDWDWSLKEDELFPKLD